LSGAEVESRYPKGDVGVYCLRISSDSFIDSALFRGAGSFANASKTTNQMPVLSATPQTLPLAWLLVAQLLLERRFLSHTASSIGRVPIPTLRPVFLSGSGTSRPPLSPASPLLPPSPLHLWPLPH